MVSCKEYVSIKKEELKKKIEDFEQKPKLCIIQVGNDDASNRYTKWKMRDCEELGIEHEHIKLPQDITQGELNACVIMASMCKQNNGVIVQLPLPKHIDVEQITNLIPPEKDVDGFRRDSLFEPCTPKGVVDYLEYNGVEFPGKVCTVVGRSEIVGRPLVNMLIKRGATVINCNSKTANLKRFTKEADVVVSAIGRANYFDETYFNHKQILVDVGINMDENGKLCGDIQESVKKNVILGTSVPGGIGVITRLVLMENVVKASEMRKIST